MTDKPILFSGPMVRALLDGRKTQTRRVLKPQPTGWNPYVWQGQIMEVAPSREMEDRQFPKTFAIGGHLWVREACATWGRGPDPEPVEYPVAYAADDPDWEGIKRDASRNSDEWKIRPSIHMPRWASRLTLIVTDVRVQRVQEISADDARAEGVQPVYDPASDTGDPAYMNYHKTGEAFAGLGAARLSFMTLWDSLNAPRGYGWDVNPWVAAYTFEVHRQNIDQMTDTLQQMRTT